MIKTPKKASIELLFFLGKEYYKEGKVKQWSGNDLITQLELNTEELNDAVNLLEKSGLVFVSYYKSSPYTFGNIKLTTDGKTAFSEIVEEIEAENSRQPIGFN